jgi:hypothetical protein
MAKMDVIKEKINHLKVWLGIFVIILIGLIGSIVSNYEKTVFVGRLGFSFIAVTWLFFSIHFLNKKILEKINSLEEL